MAPAATIEPSLFRETLSPKPSAAASPSMSAPLLTHDEPFQA